MKFRELKTAAAHAKARVATLPHVIGVGWGTKATQGRHTGKTCLTVFVREKPLPENLSKAESIPKTIALRSGRTRTDVVRLGKLRLESARHMRCENQRGTAGLFAARAPGNGILAVSCAHVMSGDDGAFTGTEVVEHYTNDWRRLGPTVDARNDDGSGTLSDWGLFDGALASVEDPAFTMALGDLTLAEPFDHEHFAAEVIALRGQPVFALRAKGTRLDAEVMAVLTDDSTPEFARHDLLIRHPEGVGLTQVGDSGLVWRLADGRPLGIHIGGYEQNEADVSTISAAYFVRRIERRFAVQLLEGAH